MLRYLHCWKMWKGFIAEIFLIRVYCNDDKSMLLLNFQDTTVTELAQDLAKKLGLKGRKAYVSPQTESTGTDGESLGETSSPTGDVGDACNIYIYIW